MICRQFNTYLYPKLRSEYLPFIKQISHIYQRPSGEVVIIDENKYYIIGFPTLQIKHFGNIYQLKVPSVEAMMRVRER
jgi:hypothetical protein